MERAGGFGQSLAHSFSLPSLVEGSEPISEADEFVEVTSGLILRPEVKDIFLLYAFW